MDFGYSMKSYMSLTLKLTNYLFLIKWEKVMEIGGPGAEEGKFLAPNAVTVDHENQIM